MLAFFAIIVGIIFLDQLTKYLAVIFLKGSAPAIIIKNIFRFTYLENRGAAFGMPVYCSHGMERTHIDGLEYTVGLMLAYVLDI